MQTRIILFFLLIGLGWVSAPPTATAARVICGVDVSLSGRCYRELRRLRRACRDTPVLCGRTYRAGEKPVTASATRRCKRMRRQSRGKWSRGLCGVRLFSPPRTYCGAKGVEVAAACIAASLPAAPAPTPTPALGQTSRSTPPAAPAAPAARRPSPLAPAARPVVSPQNARPALGMARMTTPAAPASSGTSWWVIFLQLATLLLVFYLLLKRQPNRTQAQVWESDSEEWQPPKAASKHNEHDAVLANLEQIEEKLQNWREHQDEQIQQIQSPRNEMQSNADALFSYYLQLAQHIVNEMESREDSQSEPRQRLMEARDRLHWIFRAHRELPNPSSPIDELKASSWHHIQRLLETMGHIGWESRLQTHMAIGQFSANEFLQRKSVDQAGRFLAGEELQGYISLRDEFLHCLESVFRSNLATLKTACSNQSEQMDPKDEQELFYRDYVQNFLLEELPLLLQDVTCRSSPDRSGALVDQFVQFIEDELLEAKVELFPILDAEMTETIGARLIYLLHAGIRLTADPTSVLRQPNASIMSVSVAQGDATSASELAAPEAKEAQPIRLVAGDDDEQLVVEVPSHLDLEDIDLSDDLSFEIDTEDGARASWFDSPVDEGLFGIQTINRESSDEVTAMEEAAVPSIGHPDSDSPEHTAEMSLASHGPESTVQSEPLPMGPLPHIENVTQGFVQAVPENEMVRKVTREYGPDASPSFSPDEN